MIGNNTNSHILAHNHFKNNRKFKNDQLEQDCKSSSKLFNQNLNLVNQRLLFDISHKPNSGEQSLMLLPMDYFIRKLSEIFADQERQVKSSSNLKFDIPLRFWFLCKSQICRNYSTENNECKFGERCWFVF
jgi:hypothetical protein